MVDDHTLAGAYVLDAVSDVERAEFERHLAGCGECQAEIRELRETAARLGTDQVSLPDPALRGRVLQAASRTSQLAPVVPGEPGPRRRWLRLSPGRAVLAAAACVLLAGTAVTGVMLHDAMTRLDHNQRQDRMIAAVLSAPDAVVLTTKVGSDGMARVVMSHREQALVFSAHGLNPLPGAKVYELWLMGPAGVRPAGMITSPRPGMLGPAVVSGLAPGDRIGVTIEPAGGSARPTTAPVVLIALG